MKDAKTLIVAGIVISFIAGLGVATFSESRIFFPELLRGVVITVQITLGGAVVAMIAALIAALSKMYGPMPVRWVAIGYIEIFRGTSALVQLFWLFYVLPQFGVSIEPVAVGILALGLNVGAYGAEAIRGSIQSVPRGQWEATRALNLTRLEALRRIILPQAFVAMIPPWGNLFIELMKATALVSFIALADITFKAKTLEQNNTQNTTEIFSIALLLYLAFAILITLGMRTLERNASTGLGRGRAK